MNDETPDEAPAPDPEAEEEDTGPLPGDVNPDDRFARSGKPVELADLIRASMGDLAQRTPVDQEPQPEPAPHAAIWRARRPVDNPAEADYDPDEDQDPTDADSPSADE